MEIQTFLVMYNGIITDVKSSSNWGIIKEWENEFLKEYRFKDRQDYINGLNNGYLKTEYHIVGNELVE